MTPATAEWVKKAEGDHTSMMRELRARKSPNHDGTCFHAQQCVEKYLKACLQKAGTPIERTHNRALLLDRMLPLQPAWAFLRPQLHALTTFAVDIRYPGKFATRSDARDAAALCRQVRELARAHLKLGIPARQAGRSKTAARRKTHRRRK